MKNLFLRSGALFIGFSLLFPQATKAASPKPGSKCEKIKQVKVYKGKSYTCIKSGKKKVWSKGITLSIKTSTATPTATPIATPTNTPSPNPSVPVPVTPMTALIPEFVDRIALSSASGFSVQIKNYDPNYSWRVTTTAGKVTISPSGRINVIELAPKEEAKLVVTSSLNEAVTGSSTYTSQAPYDLSSDINSIGITATLRGEALRILLNNKNNWEWSLIWGGKVQRVGITSFPYTTLGFPKSESFTLAARDVNGNIGTSKLIKPGQ